MLKRDHDTSDKPKKAEPITSNSSLEPTLALALTALILYLPANIFPFMTIEMYGNRNTTTIWSGIVNLADGGSWALAVVIFLASVLIPFLKLIILFYLGLTAKRPQNRKFKIQLYKTIEAIGRWSMLDIFLLAVLVAILKLGSIANVKPGPGALLFALVVIFTMLASASFNPQILGKTEDDEFQK
jgi:paraquat-inducible protein A